MPMASNRDGGQPMGQRWRGTRRQASFTFRVPSARSASGFPGRRSILREALACFNEVGILAQTAWNSIRQASH